MGEWWNGLSKEQRDWFIMFGILTLFMVAIAAGIVACTNAALMPLMNVCFGIAVASLLALLITSMIRLT